MIFNYRNSEICAQRPIGLIISKTARLKCKYIAHKMNVFLPLQLAFKFFCSDKYLVNYDQVAGRIAFTSSYKVVNKQSVRN
jgi:hypothetical protein